MKLKDIELKYEELTDKDKYVKDAVFMMLNRLVRMFEYENLPDTINPHIFEKRLQPLGHMIITDYKDELVAYNGNLGGELNRDYEYKDYIVANPYDNNFQTYKIDENCVLFSNDTHRLGVIPHLKRKFSEMCETDISILVSTINSRIMSLITAASGEQKAAADLYIKNILGGKLSTVEDFSFADDNQIRVQPYATGSSTNSIIQLLELRQYQRGTLYQDYGIEMNWNGKREALSSTETQLNEDILRPLVDDMFLCRQEAVDKLNRMYGLNVSVELSGVWKQNRKEEKNETEKLNEDINNEEEVDNDVDTE